MRGSVPNVVEKGIGISYPIEKPNKNKGGYTDGERIPPGAGIDHVRVGVIEASRYKMIDCFSSDTMKLVGVKV